MNKGIEIQDYKFMLLYLIPFAFFDAWAEILRGDMIVFIPILIFIVIMNTIVLKKKLNFGVIILGVIISYLVSLGVSYIAPVTIEARKNSYALMPLGVNLYILFSSIVFLFIHGITYFIMKLIKNTRGKGLYNK
ncbi:hypothetical protein [Macrococcoides caseolyticum]|uniref:hypothetical protein n=1 Tax=Macrococcoides caseolyticum TaxID=69966 RepID=UPI001F2EC55C|nr:hypothetical protein [Macrococcus caseolyticus]MCE4956815.1 hypothetical protein [Macrococcus caseolyticus]